MEKVQMMHDAATLLREQPMHIGIAMRLLIADLLDDAAEDMDDVEMYDERQARTADSALKLAELIMELRDGAI